MVVLTGAGMSAESGIPVFRGGDGLWENHRIEDVASPEGWEKDRALVLDFYNQRRKRIYEVSPNQGHLILAELERYFDIYIVTQNIDNLHERAGSTKVLHLHGEINKVRSTKNSSLIYEQNHWELKEGDMCELGFQLRPHIVWFGEAVPMMEPAITIVESAEILVIVGTSLQVYPAAGLITYAPKFSEKYIIDPIIPKTHGLSGIIPIGKGASEGLKELKEKYLTIID